MRAGSVGHARPPQVSRAEEQHMADDHTGTETPAGEPTEQAPANHGPNSWKTDGSNVRDAL